MASELHGRAAGSGTPVNVSPFSRENTCTMPVCTSYASSATARVNSVVPSAWFSTVPRYRPSVEVQPGEVGLAFIYFGPDSALPPADAEYEFTVNTSASNQDFYNTAPLKGTEAARHVMPSWAQPSTPPGSPSRARSPFQSIASTETLCSASTEHSLSRMVLQHQTHRSRSQFRSMVRVVQFLPLAWAGTSPSDGH